MKKKSMDNKYNLVFGPTGWDESLTLSCQIDALADQCREKDRRIAELERLNCLLREEKDVLVAEMINIHPHVAELEHTVASLRKHVSALKRAMVAVLTEEP